jgi:ribosomal protein L28
MKSRKMSWAGHLTSTGNKIGANRVLVGRPEGMRTLGRTRRRWEGNIKLILRNGDGES